MDERPINWAGCFKFVVVLIAIFLVVLYFVVAGVVKTVEAIFTPVENSQEVTNYPTQASPCFIEFGEQQVGYPAPDIYEAGQTMLPGQYRVVSLKGDKWVGVEARQSGSYFLVWVSTQKLTNNLPDCYFRFGGV